MADYPQIPEDIANRYKCARCEMAINHDDITGHSCIQGYTHVHLDESSSYFYGVIDGRQTMIQPSATPEVREDIVAQETVEKTKNNNLKRKKCVKLTDDEIETLILAVQRREALWDFTRHPENRARDMVRRQWQEVSIEIGGKLSAEEAKSKFKSLRDTHRKIINAENCASGSATVEHHKKWKFCAVMEFLRDSCLIRDSSTNVPPSDNEVFTYAESAVTADGDEEDHNDWETPRQTTANLRKTSSRRSSDKATNASSSAIDRLADVLAREPQTVSLPPPPQMDTVDSMLHAAGLEIRRIPSSGERMRLLMDILSMVNGRVQEHGHE